VTKSRIRSLLLPLGLAALAAILVGIYITSFRNSVTHGAGLVKVLVASREIPAGTDGSSVAGGGYLTTQTVPRRAVVAGSITTAGPLTSMVSAEPIHEGEQITLRQFKPRAQSGIFAKFSGAQRAVSVMGEPQQLLAGTLSDGDRVDVVATAHYTTPGARATTKVVLRNLLVLKAPDSGMAVEVGTGKKTSATIVMTDSQAQTMGWAMRMSNWFLALRPTDRPRNSAPSLETLKSFLARGLPASKAQSPIGGDFPESVDEP
jgi:Flp pilus assembly protein CpaB